VTAAISGLGLWFWSRKKIKKRGDFSFVREKKRRGLNEELAPLTSGPRARSRGGILRDFFGKAVGGRQKGGLVIPSSDWREINASEIALLRAFGNARWRIASVFGRRAEGYCGTSVLLCWRGCRLLGLWAVPKERGFHDAGWRMAE